MNMEIKEISKVEVMCNGTKYSCIHKNNKAAMYCNLEGNWKDVIVLGPKTFEEYKAALQSELVDCENHPSDIITLGRLMAVRDLCQYARYEQVNWV